MADAWGNSRDLFGNTVRPDGSMWDASGRAAGPGAPGASLEIAHGIPAGTSPDIAYKLIRMRLEAAQSGRVPSSAPSLPRTHDEMTGGDRAKPLPSAGRTFLRGALGLFAMAICAGAAGYWLAPAWFKGAPVAQRAVVVGTSMRAAGVPAMLPWARFAAMAPKAVRLDQAPSAVALAADRAAAMPEGKTKESALALTGAAALHCITTRRDCVAITATETGTNDEGRTLVYAAWQFLQSPAAVGVDADLATSQASILCAKSLALRIGFTWNDCVAPLDPSAGPLSAAAAQGLQGFRMGIVKRLVGA